MTTGLAGCLLGTGPATFNAFLHEAKATRSYLGEDPVTQSLRTPLPLKQAQGCLRQPSFLRLLGWEVVCLPFTLTSPLSRTQLKHRGGTGVKAIIVSPDPHPPKTTHNFYNRKRIFFFLFLFFFSAKPMFQVNHDPLTQPQHCDIRVDCWFLLGPQSLSSVHEMLFYTQPPVTQTLTSVCIFYLATSTQFAHLLPC